MKQGEASKLFLFFSVGVKGSNFEVSKQISTREPLKLKALGFRSLFQWLTQSQSAVSRSNPGDGVPPQNPTGPSGWATTA